MAKVKKKTLKNKLDKVFSLLIRSEGKCVRCYKSGDVVQLHCSHIFTRANLAVRWDRLNAKCLCATCHRWWHQNPADAIVWLSTIRSEADMKELRRRAYSVKKWEIPEMQELYKSLKEALDSK